MRSISLGLHVDPFETERILVDDTVDATVTGATDPSGPTFGASVAHGDEHVEHRLFQERRVLTAQPREQVCRDLGVEAFDAVLD